MSVWVSLGGIGVGGGRCIEGRVCFWRVWDSSSFYMLIIFVRSWTETTEDYRPEGGENDV